MIRKIVYAALLGAVIGTGAFFTVGDISQTLSTTAAKNQSNGLNNTTQVEEQDSTTPEGQGQLPKMLDLSDDIVVLLYGPIGQNGIAVAAAIKKASKENKPVWLLIDSPGGSVITGAQIVTAIQSAGVEVNTVCLTICASMAAIIHQYGTNRYMVDRSFLMFHEASGGVMGTVPQMLSQLSSMNRYINKMISHIAHRAGMSFQELNSKLAAELWLDAEDSLSSHFSDGTLNVYFNEEKAINPPSTGLSEQKTFRKEALNIQF